MSFLRVFHYSNISQRKLIDFNNFLSFLLIGILFTDLSFVLQYYFFYYPVFKVIMIFGFSGLITGNLLARWLYAKFKNFKRVYIISETAFIVIFLLYFMRNLIMPGPDEVLITLFLIFKYSIPALIFIIASLFGIKINYSIRVSCGNFIDKTPGVERLIGFMFLGLSIGIVLSGLLYSLAIPLFFATPLALLPAVFLINLPYDPAPLYAKYYEEDKEKDASSQQGKRTDTALFTYLNFLYIIVYAYLGLSSISKYYGDLIYIKLIFIALFFIFTLAGYIAGKLVKYSSLQVYGESFLPIAFLVFMILLLGFNRDLNFIAGILIFTPLALWLGVLLRHTIGAVMAEPDIIKRSSIIEFSILILPAPIFIALSLINFTNLLYYIVVCVLMLMNVIIPSIYIVNSRMEGYRKGIYFFFSLLFVPLFLFIVFFYRVHLDNNVYAMKVENFDELRNVNFNADYIQSHAAVNMNRFPVFIISDSAVRNHKRALVPISLYQPETRKILVIDGNQRFFRNPVIGYFKNSTCLDILSDRDVDYNRLPFSGTQKYVPENDPLLMYIQENRRPYFTIVDVPNLLDQTMNAFRFSGEYYRILKKHMEGDGIFAQVFNIPGCRSELFDRAVESLRVSFKRHAVFYFSNMLVVLASDNEKAFEVRQDSYERMIKFFISHEDLSAVFLNEPHILSHLLYTGLDDLRVQTRGTFIPGVLLTGPDLFRLKPGLKDEFAANNRKIFDLLARSNDQLAFNQTLTNAVAAEDSACTLLKKTEMAEAGEDYLEETKLMFELKKQAEFKIALQSYVLKMLAYKEKYYYTVALRLEKDKKWEEAQNLYKAVLLINPENFDANYRMGILSITLQDIDSSFKYLQQAMQINKENPKVLFQIGILYFSNGKTEEAIEYFNKALQQNEKIPQIYRYLGLCYEKLGNLYEAERYYAKAMLADPNDTDTKVRLDEVRSQIEKESKKWETPEQRNEAEEEQDSEMPLPVSKGAYEVRLKDNDNKLPVIDPATGEEIRTDGSAPQSAEQQRSQAEKK
jgi:tetratricopeptide (TPR) repeat protein